MMRLDRRLERSKRRKRIALSSLSLLLMAGGFLLFSTQLIQFAKGFFMTSSYSSETYKPVEKAEVVPVKIDKVEAPLYVERPENGEHMGDLFIPALDATLPIIHGTDAEQLAEGVGHFADSVLPGERDNSVLAGHRDTVFRQLGDLANGDELIVTTSAGTFTYKIHKLRIVDAADATVIVPKPRTTLTLSTCYPFNIVGATPERYIVEAHLTGQVLTPPDAVASSY